MTTTEIAAEHGVTRQTVHAHRKRGVFPKPVEGEGSTRPRFRADEVAAFFAANPPSPGKRTDLTDRDEGAAMPPTAPPDTGRAELIDAAAALLLAAITMRDLASAMPRAAFASMPDDIRGRIARPVYQGAFDALPADVQAEARALVDADPDVIAARRL
ncbi:helix-turn-helix domain-containing protein [Streptomyces sp. DASNCL29]|uniref:helix-turn-helix transcriptional regulator n=1 Tax=Streptomyces sp. DASNCL29 TaxID=2583819 RepID=UPI001F0D4EFF|nr:helix-turn-helix domain-containing protein [Streptomyces sp. DASNCL29]